MSRLRIDLRLTQEPEVPFSHPHPTFHPLSRTLCREVIRDHLGLVSNPWPRMAMNAAQHKIMNLLKTFFFFFAH